MLVVVGCEVGDNVSWNDGIIVGSFCKWYNNVELFVYCGVDDGVGTIIG